MRNWITFLMTLLVGSTISYNNVIAGQVNFEAGYRHDNISLSHHFPSSNPVLSENTKFKNLDIFQIGVNGRSTIGCNFYVRGNAYWGWILDGSFKDKVGVDINNNDYYASNDTALTFGKSRHTLIDDKYVYGINGAIGYPFFFCDCTTVVAPVIGYSIDEQNVRIHNEKFNIRRDSSSSSEGCKDRGGCCHNSFVTRWYGPFVGLDFGYRPVNECWSLFAEIEYHWGYFSGRSDADNESFFDKEKHRSRNASAWVFALGADYDVCDCWTVGFSLKFQDWKASKHHHEHNLNSDELYFVRGNDYSNDCCNDRSGNAYKWHSYAINLTVGHHF